jgi:Domain of unknown function (DUF4388)
VRLEGSLDAFSLPDIFSLLSMTKKTGGLHLRRSGAHGVVWLGDGLISGGASDLSRLSLGRRLAGSSHLSDDSLREAVEQVGRSTDLGLARALRDANAIDEGELHTLVSEHIVDTVFDLMRWEEGVFEFVVDEANIDDVGVVREVEEVVTESRQRLDTWAAIDERVSAKDTVLSLSLNPDLDPAMQRNEWALLALVDGRRTISDLVTLCGRGEYAVVVALAELVGKGLVLTGQDEGVAALLRRQDLVGTLEAETETTTSILSEVLSETGSDAGTETSSPLAEMAAIEPTISTHEEPEALHLAKDLDEDDTEDDGDSAGNGQVAEISTLPRSSSLSQDIAAATAKRPDTFGDSHEGDHPAPLAAAASGGGMVAAAAAASLPAGAIERDPSVNKSLLLRLIAGVRGL